MIQPIMIAVTNFEFAKNNAEWGTNGKGGMGHCNGTCVYHQLQWKKLIDCDTEHLLAIVKTQPLGSDYREIITSILSDRGVKA